VCILIAEAIEDVFKRSEVFNAVESKAEALDGACRSGGDRTLERGRDSA
jgi:hypothetical protein